MMNRDQVTQIVYAATDDVNELLPADRQLERRLDTALFGGPGTLDSLAILNFIVAVEIRLAEAAGKAVNLTEDEKISESDGPLSTTGALIDYLVKRLSWPTV